MASSRSALRAHSRRVVIKTHTRKSQIIFANDIYVKQIHLLRHRFPHMFVNHALSPNLRHFVFFQAEHLRRHKAEKCNLSASQRLRRVCLDISGFEHI